MAPDANRPLADDGLPNPLPRPANELPRLEQVWRRPRGWRFLGEINNNYIGLAYIATALLFFLLAGILGLLIRFQLVVPGNPLLPPGTYNQVFTMHGTVMLFLFAVPAVEAMGVTLLPGLLGARDMPFPRLSAYAYWAYLIGGLCFFASIFFGTAPDGGWFMYPPLTSLAYSPGINADMWLLGIGFIEISAIAGAIELIVGILRTRAPGMTLARMPIFAWAMLVMAGMIVFGFPPVILATTLLELERAFDFPFFIAARGGDPLLWQHLFWFFGHPEVYIIFLPAAGMVSMMVPALAGAPLVAPGLVVAALLATGFLSFGLWVHHMFATGIPALSLGYFSAASFAVAIPSGIQVFAWIATIASGKIKWEVPTLYVLGFLFIFTLGGLTGVMVAAVPFDWQAHDSYFIVAHLHYVLIGGMVFPLLGAFYYWAPTFTGAKLSDRLGKWGFWLLFLGTNLTFFPMHVSGLMGLPRRVYTYPAGMGLELWNVLSTAGAVVSAAGVAVFLLDVALNFRIGRGRNANPWGAGTLEWAPTEVYGLRSIPWIGSREPLWDRPGLPREIEAGRHLLPGTVTGNRESIVTSPVDAIPQYVAILPGPGFAHVLAAVGTAAFFLLLVFKAILPAMLGFALGLGGILWWLWTATDKGPVVERAEVGGGLVLPVYATGSTSTAWWALVVLILVDATGFLALCGSDLYLWLIHGAAGWPPEGFALPEARWPLLAAGGLVLSGALVLLASRLLDRVPRGGAGSWAVSLALLLALALTAGAWAADTWGHWSTGIRGTTNGHGAAVFASAAWQGFHLFVVLVMALYAIARALAGKLDGVRRVTFDVVMLFWLYTVAQGSVGLLTFHLFPRLVG
ncbi:cbb3-type cytochrome c oxidase subunit I [Roseomonas sp. OT10]|uniref:cbb3-type cytochrome c oxidase subunit I n=1 Tax=Roseomonas cutis TaxID=2897332 RepID=UPI001E47C0F2|nr:cbb3-type cytochrome c oxidase subunit I [Roseomonas sp. OT10]UFN49995.1 cbb3-type cytochrome c oxidase subunit I [Roseomonas sp. OT10]